MAKLHGNATWRRYMDTLHGIHFWKVFVCLEVIHTVSVISAVIYAPARYGTY